MYTSIKNRITSFVALAGLILAMLSSCADMTSSGNRGIGESSSNSTGGNNTESQIQSSSQTEEDTSEPTVPLDGETLKMSKIYRINAFSDGKAVPMNLRVSILERENLKRGGVILLELLSDEGKILTLKRFAGVGFAVIDTPAEDKTSSVFVYHITAKSDKSGYASTAVFQVSDINTKGESLSGLSFVSLSATSLSFSVADKASIAVSTNKFLNFSHTASDDLRSFKGNSVSAYISTEKYGIPNGGELLCDTLITDQVQKLTIEDILYLYE